MSLTRSQMNDNWDKAEGAWRWARRKSKVSGIADKIRSATEPMPPRPISEIRAEQESHRNYLRRLWVSFGGIFRQAI